MQVLTVLTKDKFLLIYTDSIILLLSDKRRQKLVCIIHLLIKQQAGKEGWREGINEGVGEGE